jgi:O-acetyl-ADP-ribose deacetylase (regulator of RNase III)
MEIVLGDITKIPADAIVNAANTQLKHGGGVAAAIAKAGGQTIQKESNDIGWVDIGKVAVTSAGDLPAKSVIHIPTIDYATGRKASMDEIKKGLSAALDIAKNSNFKKITFPVLGAGVVGFDPGVIARNIKEVADTAPEIQSTLVAHSQSDYDSIKELF